MNKYEFDDLTRETLQTFSGKIHESHKDKPASWQFLIQLNTDLPYGDKLTYGLPLDMCGLEDSEDKTRSIVLWRMLQNNVPVETIVYAARRIDELREEL